MSRNLMVAGALAAALAAASPGLCADPAPAAPAERSGSEQGATEPSAWMREQAARLAEELEALKDRLLTWGRDAGPALDKAQQELGEAKEKLETEMPRLRDGAADMLERLKGVASEVDATLQGALDEFRQRLRRETEERPKELRT
jgi:hypothetical protein